MMKTLSRAVLSSKGEEEETAETVRISLVCVSLNERVSIN
jgi:hypothetical protein